MVIYGNYSTITAEKTITGGIPKSRECQNRRTYGPNRSKYQKVRRS